MGIHDVPLGIDPTDDSPDDWSGVSRTLGGDPALTKPDPGPVYNIMHQRLAMVERADPFGELPPLHSSAYARKRVLFLDMDGVICTQRAAVGLNDHARANTNGFIHALDPIVMGMLNRLACAGVKMVSSSAWRLSYPVREVMQAAGYQGEFCNPWRTPDFGMGNRGHEIKWWLHHFQDEWDEYVIWDDNDWMLDEQKTRFVHTAEEDGVSYADWQRTLDILDLWPNEVDPIMMQHGV